MADNYLNKTGLGYYHERIKALFASQTDLDALDTKVEGIIAEGGEPNVIETVKVNGTALPPDADKAVNVEAAQLEASRNNGELQGMYAVQGSNELRVFKNGRVIIMDDTDTVGVDLATHEYVDENGGKIDAIKVNGTTQPITNKEVDIAVPTKVSDLTNDSGFLTASDVSGAITTALANGGDAYQTASDVSTAIDAAVASAFTYKGAVATEADLPSTGNKKGDVWDVQATGVNYAWSGTAWDALGSYVDTSALWGKSELVALTTAEIDTILAG